MPRRRLEPIRIGGHTVDPPVLLAPLAAVTTPAFRILCEEMGVGLTFTEMVSVAGLVRNAEKVAALVRPSSGIFAVQLLGSHPEEMEQAARMVVSMGAQIVDLNMGCPARKVLKTGAGAALMLEPERAAELVLAARAGAGSVPVTAKIRSGWDEESGDPVVLAEALERAGAAWITIHGRTRRQVFSGPVDLQAIRRVREAVGVPVIGNGGIFSVEDAERMVSETGCAGVMVGRGAMGRPWIFRELAAWALGRPIPSPPSLEERRAVMMAHLELYLREVEPDRAVREMRKHLAWYSKGLKGGAEFRRAVFQARTPQEVRRFVAELGR